MSPESLEEAAKAIEESFSPADYGGGWYWQSSYAFVGNECGQEVIDNDDGIKNRGRVMNETEDLIEISF